MPTKLIWSGIVTSENIHDTFFHICGVLEGKTYSVEKKTMKSNSHILSQTDQVLLDSTIEKKGITSEISIKGNKGDVLILQLLNPLHPKRDPKCPYVKISTDKILIENQNRRGIKERVVITINS